MAILEKTIGDKKVYQVSIGMRSKIRPEIRVQRLRKMVTSLRAAQALEKELIKECALQLARLEGTGVPWIEVLDGFELAHRKGSSLLRPVQLNHLHETISTLRRFAPDWEEIPCQEISPADVRRVLTAMEMDGYSNSRMRAVKSGINTVFKWGIESGLIKGILQSPTTFVQIQRNKNEKPPPILTHQEIQKLITAAKEVDHAWYPVWFMALNTGMRSGELYALEWTDVDLEQGIIMVSKSYNNRMDITKSTKAGYWRTVPINRDLDQLLRELKYKISDKPEEAKFVLPRLQRWANGEAAKFLRDFCREIGITEVHFHALRACFATHLLNAGVESTKVKKICGWTEEKVMSRYIRLAGVEVKGVTDRLGFVPEPSANASVISLREVSLLRKEK